MERAFHLAQTGRPGSGAGRRADGHLLRRSAGRRLPARCRRRSRGRRSTRRPCARIVEALAAAERPVLYAGGGVLSARATRGARGAGRGARAAGRAHADGQGLPARGPSAAARQTGFWGTPIANDKCRDRRPHPRRRHAARRSELELVGSAVHVRDSADAADSHRRRRRGDRPQLSRPSSASSPTRSWRSARWPRRRAA